MEYASYLAGERWSDHPECTHGLLAGVARGVNDHISDDARSTLVELIPSVIGLTGDDPHVDAGIAIRCAATALPVVSDHRQRALAVGLIAAQRWFDDPDHAGPATIDTRDLLDHAQRALSTVPLAAEWADEFATDTRLTTRALRSRSAPCMVRLAIMGIAEACIPDPDGLLREMLATVIGDCTEWLGSATSPNIGTHELRMAGANI